jgi:hypothetical protein
MLAARASDERIGLFVRSNGVCGISCISCARCSPARPGLEPSENDNDGCYGDSELGASQPVRDRATSHEHHRLQHDSTRLAPVDAPRRYGESIAMP